MDGQTVYFGLNTISSFSKAVMKKNGKRDALALQDLGILIKLNGAYEKKHRKENRKEKEARIVENPGTRIKGECKEFSEKRKDFNLMVTGLEVKLE